MDSFQRDLLPSHPYIFLIEGLTRQLKLPEIQVRLMQESIIHPLTHKRAWEGGETSDRVSAPEVIAVMSE